jgi:hypothetical protein
MVGFWKRNFWLSFQYILLRKIFLEDLKMLSISTRGLSLLSSSTGDVHAPALTLLPSWQLALRV